MGNYLWFLTSPDRGSGGVGSATEFKILCFNANSIGRNPKRQNVFHYVKRKNPDFVFICDTKFSKSVENCIREEWGGKCFFSSFSSQARGVAIFLKKGNTATIIDTHSDKDGNIVAILVSYQSKTILMECSTKFYDFLSARRTKKDLNV